MPTIACAVCYGSGFDITGAQCVCCRMRPEVFTKIEQGRGGVMDEIPTCACGEFWGAHHPECPVRREIERLRAELAALVNLRAEADSAWDSATYNAERARKAEAELAECREDAERWRYLRDDGCGFEITVREENEDGYESWVSGYPGAELDAAIDAARKGEGE